ncbi:MAG: hypothetical protein HQ591_13145 [candidate division Zixibacteria bacterium]|nr:hypothetical protein [Candidatus Tariuqbacter arcticus]
MSHSKVVLFIFSGIFFLTATIYPAYSQTTRHRQRLPEFKKVEVYFDGGYYFTGMSPANDAIEQGGMILVDVLNFLNEYTAGGEGVIEGSDQEIGNSRSMGGGLNFNLNRNFGMGIKFITSQHAATSHFLYKLTGFEYFDPYLGAELLIDVQEDYVTHSKYHFAPVLVNAYYRMNPIPAMKGLSCKLGAGGGLYTTSIDIEHTWQSHRELSEYAFYDLPNNFYEYKNRYVAQPLGGYVFGEIDFKGSEVISFSLNLEYHYVPETDLKDDNWHIEQDLMYWPSVLEYDEEFFEYMFSGYLPDKLSISGLRMSATVKFGF